MPQAIVDPEELRQFALSLKRFQAELRERLGAIQHQLDALGATWRDQEHQKFVDQFYIQARSLATFAELMDQHVRYLVRKADQVDEYLNS